MTKYSAIAVGVGVLTMSIACSEMTTPVGPSPMMALSVSAEVAAASASTGSTEPVITMQSDYTASPSYVQVKIGNRVKFVNNSGKYFQIHSNNCSQFTMVDPSPGSWVRSGIFNYTGKICNFYAWDTNWSRKLFEGKVEVVP